MERYDSYKDSGVDWIGLIPEHWNVTPLFCLMDEISQKNEYCTVTNQLQFKFGSIVEKSNQVVDSAVAKIISSYTIVNTDDIIINGLNLNYDFVTQRVAKVTKYGVITSAYICLRPKNLTFPCYFNYLLKTMDNKKMLNSMGTGIRQTLSYKQLRHINLSVPPISEQQAIVAYLDEETGKLDAAVEKLERMVEILKERKQLIISKAVTRGLDDSVPLKDSGVEWIGQIPEHWNLFRLRYLCKIKTGDKDTVNRVENGIYPFFVRSPKVERINSYSFDGEAVLMAGDGVGAGKVFHHVNGKFGCHQRVYILHNFNKIIGLFLYYFMQNKFQHTIEQLSAKSTVDSVRLNMIKDFCVSLPSLTEQQAIAAYLDEKVGKLDEAIEKQLRMIELLKERKQILISDVVTGKIKVA